MFAVVIKGNVRLFAERKLFFRSKNGYIRLLQKNDVL